MISELSELVKHINNLDISKFDSSFLAQMVKKRCALVGTETLSDYVQYITLHPDEADMLFHSLHISYTEFFRNTLTFAHLEQWILPSLIERKPENSELRIWSAGCSSGQEAYSIAMLIENLSIKNKRYRIIATDISESVLIQAKHGKYAEHDIQKIRIRDLHEHFIRSEGSYTIADQVKEHILFSHYDLLSSISAYPQESIFGNFDLVICSNVLLYYAPEMQHEVVKKLINSMDSHGFLITGEAERQAVEKFKNLYQVVPPSPIYQQRRNRR